MILLHVTLAIHFTQTNKIANYIQYKGQDILLTQKQFNKKTL